MSCQLTPAASAFSSIISALVGSVINGFASGWLVAFVTGWIAWMAIFRVLLSGVYMFYRSVTNSWGTGKKSEEAYTSVNSNVEVDGISLDNNTTSGNGNSYDNCFNNTPNPYSNVPAPVYYNPHNGPNNSSFTYPPNPHNNSAALDALRPQHTAIHKPIISFTDNFKAIWPSPPIVRALQSAFFKRPPTHAIIRTWSDLNHDVTFLGWFSWSFTALYAPISQAIWLATNLGVDDRGAAKLVKGLTVAVTALPLCIDCKVRYGERLPPGILRIAFNLITSISVLLQGVFCGILLVTGAIDIKSSSKGPFFLNILFIVYPIFAIIWMFISYQIVPMRDGGRKRAAQAHWAGYFLDVGIGAFSGLFLAAPALILYFQATRGGFGGDNGASDLGDYLSCETSLLWKWAAVMP